MRNIPSLSLDPLNHCVVLGDNRVQLGPKAFGVLSYLVDNPDRIVTKRELLEAVWPATFVGDAVLKTCVLEIRKALGENAGKATHIETVHRRGYRFLADGKESGSAKIPAAALATSLVGRRDELQSLLSVLNRARSGKRQIVFLTGEPGIGKSALVDRFRCEVSGADQTRILKGGCAESFGSAEPYYPVFKALTEATRTFGPQLVSVLRKHAPTWLADMPSLLTSAELGDLKQETLGATRYRMVREMSHTLETLAHDDTLVLVLEDLHWSDYSTLDLISALAAGEEDARLLLIATYRPGDATVSEHPVRILKQQLVARSQAHEIELTTLSREGITELAALRLPHNGLTEEVIDVLYGRTGGHPLFVLNLLEYATSQGLLTLADGKWMWNNGGAQPAVPDSIARVIEAQIAKLTSEEKVVLEAASVAGSPFHTSVLTADGSRQQEKVQAQCEKFAAGGVFIRLVGEASVSDARPPMQYEFIHSLYRDVLYHRISPDRRVRIHREIGDRVEVVFSDRLGEVASELAMHFQQSCDYIRAIQYFRLLADLCASRHAFHEGSQALTFALNLCERLTESQRSETWLILMEQLGLFHRLMGQLSSAAACFEEMFENAGHAGRPEIQVRALFWLASVSSWIDRQRCLQASERAVQLCRDNQLERSVLDDALAEAAYWNLLFKGWNAADECASSSALEAARSRQDHVSLALQANRHSFFLALSSQYRQSSALANQGIALSLGSESGTDYLVGHYFNAWSLLHMGEWGACRRVLDSAMELAGKNGHVLWKLLFDLMEAFLHCNAFSFRHPRDRCREYVALAAQTGHPLSRQMGLVLLGWAELGGGNLKAAEASFLQLREWQSQERILMDWIWRIVLQLGFAKLRLAQGDLASAETDTALCLSLAGATSERTWTAWAHYYRAAMFSAKGMVAGAGAEIDLGLQVVAGYEAPLARFRLSALAYHLLGDNNQASAAEREIQQVAHSMAAEDPLRQTFLTGAASSPFGSVIL